MDFAAGDVANTDADGWWNARSTSDFDGLISPVQTSLQEQKNILATAFAQDYCMLADIAANMRSGFVLLNQRELVTYSNAKAERLLKVRDGAQGSARTGVDVRQRLLSLVADPDYVRNELDRVWVQPEIESSVDLALADAVVRWLRVRSFPVYDQPGNLLGRGIFLDDITLERSSLQSRGETLALAAHELKTPLAVIKGCATTLLGNSARWDPAIQREMLQMIDSHTDRLYEILNTLLDVWRLDGGVQNLRLSQIQVQDLLSQLVARWQKASPRHFFLLKFPPQVAPVMCDAVRLEQAFNQLLNNAVTYSPDGGTIRVQVEQNEAELRISISDEGIGIPSEALDRIFDRFYRIEQGENEIPERSGLGLAIARSVLAAHGGRIWADSQGIGQGASFYCVLPTMPQAALIQQTGPLPALLSRPASEPVWSGTRPLTSKNKHATVLIAETDARLVRYLRANLEEQRYKVNTVGHGVHFLRQFDLGEPDLILLATHLSDVSGIELLQQVREFSTVPVIMLCNPEDEDERIHLLDLGADDLVSKPFNIDELQARIRALLRRRATVAGQAPAPTIFSSGDLTIDFAQRQVFVQGRPVQLSRTEYKLLQTLAQNAGMVVTHELLLEKVWGPEYNREVDFIWVYISRLRRKIEADSRHPRYILTVPDVGYRLAKS
jgi:DNA-binding response OmpR family regulator/signal transduction histidine kinase